MSFWDEIKTTLGFIFLLVGSPIFYYSYAVLSLFQNSFTIQEIFRNQQLYEGWSGAVLYGAFGFAGIIFGSILVISNEIARLKPNFSELKQEFKLYYDCPNCREPIQYSVSICPYCNTKIEWKNLK